MSKFAFIDVDGTLTAGKESSWEKVHRHFGLNKEMEDHSKRYFSGEITYEQWALLDVGLWKGKSIDELKVALNPPELINGAKEGILQLKNNGYKIVLLSGGVHVMVNEVAKLVGADFAFSNVIGEENGILNGTVKEMVGLKSKIIKQLQKQHEINLADSVAIGDHFNDIDMFELVGKNVAINPKTEKLIEVSDHVIETDNFTDAVNLLLNGS